LPLKVCNLVNKFWEHIWRQGDKNWGFGVKMDAPTTHGE